MKNISVAMAVYNGEKFIEKQLDSILSQLKEGDEIIISYDESTDRSYEIIKDYEKRYDQVKVYANPGSGLFSNFENAIDKCQKDYIFICDQDDLWTEDKRQRVVDDFARYDCGMVIHNLVHIDAEDQIISEDFFTMYSIDSNLIKNFLKPRYSGCCTAFTKELKDVILPIPRGVGAYDHWIGMVGQCFSKVYFDKHVLLLHRLHGENVTVTSRRKLTTVLRVRADLLACLIKRKITGKTRKNK